METTMWPNYSKTNPHTILGRTLKDFDEICNTNKGKILPHQKSYHCKK